MARHTFRLPDVGEGTAEAEIVAWHVAVGDTVEEDAPLVDVMTDKATVEITSPVSGVVLERRGEPGEMFAVGGDLLVFETMSEAAAEPVIGAPNPSGQRNAEAREAPPTTPLTERAAARTPSASKFSVASGAASDAILAGFTFRLPDVGEGTAEAEIVAWHVQPGDMVEEDQPLVDVMTDKATVEITAPRAGRIASIHGEPGKMLAVGSPLAVFAQEASSAGAAHSSAEAGAYTSSSAPVDPPRPGGINRTTPAGGGSPTAPAFFESDAHRVLTSPAIRRRAREAGVDLTTVKGSGLEGRVTREDLDAHLATPALVRQPSASSTAVAEEITEVRVMGLRRKISEKMSEAKRRIPHFAYMEECDVTALEELRAHLNATKSASQPKLTLLPFMIRALCKALPRFPQINARYDDEAGVVRRYRAVHLGMATQTPNGLIVPVIRDAQAHDIWSLAGEIGRLAKTTREGKAQASELSGSTITLTSLGPLGGLVHTPVINHPEVAIVGPNKIIERPVVREGQIVVRKMMNVSSSFDHRVVDGWDAAEFIQAIKALLEHPATLFMG